MFFFLEKNSFTLKQKLSVLCV